MAYRGVAERVGRLLNDADSELSRVQSAERAREYAAEALRPHRLIALTEKVVDALESAKILTASQAEYRATARSEALPVSAWPAAAADCAHLYLSSEHPLIIRLGALSFETKAGRVDLRNSAGICENQASSKLWSTFVWIPNSSIDADSVVAVLENIRADVGSVLEVLQDWYREAVEHVRNGTANLTYDPRPLRIAVLTTDDDSMRGLSNRYFDSIENGRDALLADDGTQQTYANLVALLAQPANDIAASGAEPGLVFGDQYQRRILSNMDDFRWSTGAEFPSAVLFATPNKEFDVKKAPVDVVGAGYCGFEANSDCTSFLFSVVADYIRAYSLAHL